MDNVLENFCLWGGQAQRNLKTSQYAREKVVMGGKCIGCYSYREFGSKNCQGGTDSFNMQNKVVQQYENGSNLQRCYIDILGKYLDVLPEGAKANDVFYLIQLPKNLLNQANRSIQIYLWA